MTQVGCNPRDNLNLSVLLLRLVVLLCVFHLNSGICRDVILGLLRTEKERNHCKISACFLQALWGSEKDVTANATKEALKATGGPLVIVSTGRSHPKLSINDAIYLQTVNHNKEDLLGTLPQIMSDLAKMQTMKRSFGCIHHLFALIRIHSFKSRMKGVEGSKAECLGSF